jgi:ribonuclease HI
MKLTYALHIMHRKLSHYF